MPMAKPAHRTSAQVLRRRPRPKAIYNGHRPFCAFPLPDPPGSPSCAGSSVRARSPVRTGPPTRTGCPMRSLRSDASLCVAPMSRAQKHFCACTPTRPLSRMHHTSPNHTDLHAHASEVRVVFLFSQSLRVRGSGCGDGASHSQLTSIIRNSFAFVSI